MPRTKQTARRVADLSQEAHDDASSQVARPVPNLKDAEELEEDEHIAKMDRATRSCSAPSMWTKFPLVVLVSLALSSLLYSLSAQFTAGELASLSRTDGGWELLVALLGWRGAELGLSWFAGYDSYDMVSLMVLSHYPPIYLLSAFYGISKSTAITSLVIDGLATYIPFRLFRPVSVAHQASSEDEIPSHDIITDPYIQALNIILAASIYSTTLYASYMSFLPTTLVQYFNEIPTVLPAHTSTPISLLPVHLILGLASHSFIFTPAAALSQARVRSFDPATATFQETLWYNLWGFSDRSKMIIKRTAVLAGVVGFNGLLQLWATIKGVEFTGAAVYSGVWALASLITGVVFSVVCNV